MLAGDETEAEQAQVFGGIMEWFGKHWAGTTVILEYGSSTIVDCALLEAKEAIGGYAVVDVADLDAALALARSFPMPDGKVEVRPVVER
jgi:hypothetical protein